MAGRAIRATMAGRATRVTTAGRTTEKGAHAYLTKRIITATKATATLTITATGITDSPARGIRGATMKAGLDCRFPPTPTIGV